MTNPDFTLRDKSRQLVYSAILPSKTRKRFLRPEPERTKKKASFHASSEPILRADLNLELNVRPHNDLAEQKLPIPLAVSRRPESVVFDFRAHPRSR